MTRSERAPPTRRRGCAWAFWCGARTRSRSFRLRDDLGRSRELLLNHLNGFALTLSDNSFGYISPPGRDVSTVSHCITNLLTHGLRLTEPGEVLNREGSAAFCMSDPSPMTCEVRPVKRGADAIRYPEALPDVGPAFSSESPVTFRKSNVASLGAASVSTG